MASIIWRFPTLPLVFSVLLVIASGLRTFFDNTVKRPGEDFMAGCADDNYTISWLGPSGPLTTETKPQVEVTHYGTVLHFRKPTEKDSGNYTCSTSVDSRVMSILINVPIDFVDTPSLQTAIEFQQNFLIKCEAKGGIKPKLSWYTAEGEVAKPNLRVLADGLLITNVTLKDAGVYICKATERYMGALKERNITLRVEHKPYPRDGTVWTEPEPAWGFLGSVVNLTCEVIAEPQAKYEWRQPIKNHGKIFNDTANASFMQVNITSQKVFGNYTCRVWNKYGFILKTIALEAGEQPQPPEIVDQQAENSDLLDIGIVPPAAPTGLMKPIGFIIQYRLVEPKKPQENKWKEQYFSINDKNSYILKNLQPNSKYEVRVATKNVAGLSEFTNISSKFFTLESASTSSTSDGVAFFHRMFLMISVLLLPNW